jgi:hypothetical protein
MGALNFIRSFFGGNPREVVKLGKGGAGAVNPPTIVKLPETFQMPKFCRATFLMIARKKGATVSEIAEKTGKTKGTIYQEIALIKKSGIEIVRAYEKPAYRFRVG